MPLCYYDSMAKRKKKHVLHPLYFSIGILFMLLVTVFILLVHYIATRAVFPKIPFSTYTSGSIILAKQYSEPDGLYTLSLPASWILSYYPWSEGPVNRSWTYFASQMEPDTFFTISAEIISDNEKHLHSNDFPALADAHLKDRFSKLWDFRPVINARRAASIGNAVGIQYEISLNSLGSSQETQNYMWTYLPATDNYLLILEQQHMNETSQEKINTIVSSLRIHEIGE